MITCPWCTEQVILDGDVCPACKMAVLPEHLSSATEIDETEQSTSTNEPLSVELSIEDQIHNRFKCATCGGDECDIQEGTMSGAGISKILDIDYKHYLFVSCTTCGIVVVYNPDVLRGYKSGRLGTALDILFG